MKTHREELNDLKSSSNIVRVIKSRIMRGAGYVKRMGERRCVCSVLVGNLRDRDHLGNLGIDGRIILRRILRKRVVGVRTGWSWLRIGTFGGHL